METPSQRGAYAARLEIRAGGPKRRKAMETGVRLIVGHLHLHGSRGAKTPKGNGDAFSARRVCSAVGNSSRGAKTPKGNGDRCAAHCRTSSSSREPGGQNAERQWRRLLSAARMQRGWKFEPGGQNAERQWRHLKTRIVVVRPAGSQGAKTPKGNGDLD